MKCGQANREKSQEEELQNALLSNCSLSSQLLARLPRLFAVPGTGTWWALLCVMLIHIAGISATGIPSQDSEQGLVVQPQSGEGRGKRKIP